MLPFSSRVGPSSPPPKLSLPAQQPHFLHSATCFQSLRPSFVLRPRVVRGQCHVAVLSSSSSLGQLDPPGTRHLGVSLTVGCSGQLLRSGGGALAEVLGRLRTFCFCQEQGRRGSTRQHNIRWGPPEQGSSRRRGLPCGAAVWGQGRSEDWEQQRTLAVGTPPLLGSISRYRRGSPVLESEGGVQTARRRWRTSPCLHRRLRPIVEDSAACCLNMERPRHGEGEREGPGPSLAFAPLPARELAGGAGIDAGEAGLSQAQWAQGVEGSRPQQQEEWRQSAETETGDGGGGGGGAPTAAPSAPSASSPSALSSPGPRQLPPGLDPQRLPRHVAMILDGNSRWAQRRGLPKEMGHKAGVQALKRTVRHSAAWGILALTAFVFSTENWNRPKAEVDFLMALLERMLKDDVQELHREGVVVRCVGDISGLAPSLQKSIQDSRELTQANPGLKLTIAFNYSGRQDIVQACRSLAALVAAGQLSPSAITEEAVGSQLATAWLGEALSSPDLLVRTSGEQRISNFLLWQLAYTELVFCNCLWPDFDKEHYIECLAQFQARDRRFGGRSERH